MACENGLVYYIIGWDFQFILVCENVKRESRWPKCFLIKWLTQVKGIATLASGMCIYWVGYIDYAAGGLHLEDHTPENKTFIELEERNAEI